MAIKTPSIRKKYVKDKSSSRTKVIEDNKRSRYEYISRNPAVKSILSKSEISAYNKNNQIAISAVEHFNEKYAAIENDYSLGVIPASTYYPEEVSETVNPPTELFVVLNSTSSSPGEELTIIAVAPSDNNINSVEISHNLNLLFY